MFKNTVMLIFLIFLIIEGVISRNIIENNSTQNSSEDDNAALVVNNIEEPKTFDLISDENDSSNDNESVEKEIIDISEGRTYAHHFAKRMAVLLLPLMFKLGVVMTMLAFLTIISVKSLIVGVGLMVVGLSHVLARAYQSSILQQPLVQPAPVVINPYAGLLRQPLPPGYVAGWEKRSSNVAAPRSHDPHRDAYNKQYAPPVATMGTPSIIDLQSAASTNHGGTTSYYVLNSGPDAGVVQTYH